MPFHARESLNLLLESDVLDGLLSEAREQAAKLAGGASRSLGQEIEDLDARTEEVQKHATEAAAGLRSSLEERAASRAEKVAIVQHILKVGSRLVT